MRDIDTSKTSAEVPPPAAARRVRPTNSFAEFKLGEIEQSIPDRFEKQVAEYPDRVAVKSRYQELTYDALNQIANRVARAVLAQRGKGEEPIALLLEQGAPLIAAILGVLKAGKIYVPLDPSFPRARLTYMLEDSQAALILTNNKNLAMAEEFARRSLPPINIDEFDTSARDENPGLSISPDALAYILYTSGSTGRPKGVVQKHRNLLHEIMNYTNEARICADDRLSLLRSCSFAGAMRDVFGALLNGAGLYPWYIKDEGLADLPGWLIEQQVTIYRSSVTAFRHFINALTGREEFPRIRLVYLAGESVYKSDVELYKKHFSPDCILVNGLGCSESFTFRWYFIDKETPIINSNVPAGYEIDGMETRLIDEAGKEVGPDEIGEIAVKSRYLSPGYWQRPDLTQAAFFPDPSGGGERTYRTGDLGRMLSDGCLVHLGRKDFQVKIRGYRVEIGEIEMTLLEHGKVREAAVVARDDKFGGKRLVAYVVPHQEQAFTVSELHRFLQEKLPEYMLPSAFVMLDALPLTPSRKVDRRALPEPEPVRPELENPFVAPRTVLEEGLAALWAKILGLERVGIHDDFFDLGGQSLLAIRLFLEIEKELGRRLPVVTLFQGPTIAQLADVLQRKESSAPWSPMVAIQAAGSERPFFCMHTLGGEVIPYFDLARNLGPEQPFYGLQAEGLDGKRPPFTRIEEMASKFIAELRKLQPEGPYLLGGMCYGGIVAFEMAQQLQAQGQEIGLLALMDTPRPPFSVIFRSYMRYERYVRRLRGSVRYFLRRSARHLRNLLKLSPVAWPAYFLKKARIAKELTIDRTSPRAELVRASHLTEAYRARVERAHRIARQSYNPQGYRGRISLFLVSQPLWKRFPDPRMGWTDLATDGVEVYIIPGGHHDLLREPSVRVLAENLSRCLHKAQKKHDERNIQE